MTSGGVFFQDCPAKSGTVGEYEMDISHVSFIYLPPSAVTGSQSLPSATSVSVSIISPGEFLYTHYL